MSKETTITIRCTEKQKELITKNAKRQGLSNSKYILNKCFKKRNRYKTQSDKKVSESLVCIQRDLNNLNRLAIYCRPYSGEIINAVQDIKEKEAIIWQNSLR